MDASFLFNSMFLLACACLVMFMSAGFTMLEAGAVRAKSVVVILTKNISLYAISCVMFYLVGYQLMFDVAPGGFLGNPGIWFANDAANVTGSTESLRADGAFWFFQMVFVATAASIVSGALAERLRLWPFLVFVAVLTAVVYPVVGSWTWGGGWLAERGFHDFAGSTVVHSVGGWAALAGALLLGARRGRFDSQGRSTPLPSASAPQMAIGTLILWFGWFGFNGGSQLSFSSSEDAIAVAQILANTNLAAAGGVIAALGLAQLMRGRPDMTLTLNGALAGLVAITADPSTPTMLQAMLIGGGGALAMTVAMRLLERFRVDDVVGAIPVHLAAGIFGTLVAGLSSESGSLGVQALGIIAIGAFTFASTGALWLALRLTVGIRLNYAAEVSGADHAEMGARAYYLDLDPTDTTSHPSLTALSARAAV